MLLLLLFSLLFVLFVQLLLLFVLLFFMFVLLLLLLVLLVFFSSVAAVWCPLLFVKLASACAAPIVCADLPVV